ncbi:hypothetical protein LguiA_036482 [Lonicera macranthoides]
MAMEFRFLLPFCVKLFDWNCFKYFTEFIKRKLDIGWNEKWGLEKLVYKDPKTKIRRDHKYAVQPPSVFATKVHMSENIVGKTTHKIEGRIMYYHYHGTISKR